MDFEGHDKDAAFAVGQKSLDIEHGVGGKNRPVEDPMRSQSNFYITSKPASMRTKAGRKSLLHLREVMQGFSLLKGQE